LFYLFLASFIAEVCIFSLHLYHINNLFVSRIYTLVEFLLLSLFYIKVISHPTIKLVMKLAIIVFIAITITDLFVNGFRLMDNLSSTAASILLMVYSLTAFAYLAGDPNPAYSNIFSIPLFWFYTGILTFFSCDLFLFIFSNYIEKHYSKISFELWGIHSVNNIIYYILISTGFWKTKLR